MLVFTGPSPIENLHFDKLCDIFISIRYSEFWGGREWSWKWVPFSPLVQNDGWEHSTSEQNWCSSKLSAVALAKIPGDVNLLSFSKGYGLVPLESIRAVVEIVLKETFLHLVDEGRPHRAEASKFREGNKNWESEQYYLSRFFRPKCEEFLM